MIESIRFIVLPVLLFVSQQLWAQDGGYAERARNYVKQYAKYAIENQKESGVPAAITLGQGILETEAGISELVTEANNHFGIKCKNGWTGPTFLHTDDLKDECFKKYNNALESYKDHSAHLQRNPRYKPLFSYSLTDYARWAHGLKKCGYATNPKYAQILIKIIEDYKLQQYTYMGIDGTYESPDTEIETIVKTLPSVTDTVVERQGTATVGATTVITTTTTTTKTVRIKPSVPSGNTVYTDEESTPATAAKTPANAGANTGVIRETSAKGGIVAASGTETGNNPIKESIPAANGSDTSIYPAEEPLEESDVVQTVNGLKAVRAHKEDALLPYAVKYKIRYAHLLELNDLPDEPLAFDTWLYLEKKNPTGKRDKHTVKEGETLIAIAQEEGMQLRRLAAFNLMNAWEQPAAGEVLNLQTQATTKPKITEYKMPSALPKEEVKADNSNPVYKAAKEEIGTSMSFDAPKGTEPLRNASVAKQRTVEVDETPAPKLPKQQPQVTEEKEDEEETPAKATKPAKKQATVPKDKKGSKQYVVKKGDTYFSIAKKNHVTVAELKKWNKIAPDDLRPGQKIVIKK